MRKTNPSSYRRRMAHGEEFRGEARGWEPGDLDRAANWNLVYIFLLVLFVAVFFVIVTGGEACASIGLVLALGVIGLVVFFYLLNYPVGSKITAERVKHYEIGPDRLTRAVVEALDHRGLRYTRNGPHQSNPDSWLDKYHLMSYPFEGIIVVSERNPLSARESLSQCKLQCTKRADPQFDELQGLIDEHVRVEKERGSESREWTVPPEYMTLIRENPGS